MRISEERDKQGKRYIYTQRKKEANRGNEQIRGKGMQAKKEGRKSRHKERKKSVNTGKEVRIREER